jgi:hypothetical protein
VLWGTALIPLPQAEPAPWPGQTCRWSGRVRNFARLFQSARAAPSAEPATFAAFSSRSGRPTSPTKTKSPVAIPIGALAPAVSVTTNARCSGVCPGVWSTSIRMLPTMK